MATLFIVFGTSALVAQSEVDPVALDLAACVRGAAGLDTAARKSEVSECVEQVRDAYGPDPAALWAVDRDMRQLVQDAFATLVQPNKDQSTAYAHAYQNALDTMSQPPCVGRYVAMTIWCGVINSAEDMLAIFVAAALMED